MQTLDRYLPWSIRIIIAGLFIISAYGKIYPDPSAYGTISMFEIKQLHPLGFSTEWAKIFSRALIGVEFGLGCLLLFPFDLKRIVLPATVAMLAIFVVHLTIQILTVGNSGNCGCFGALLPMTPLEAIMKNLLSIGLLVILWKRYGNHISQKSNFWFLTTIISLSMLLMFVFIPTFKATTAMNYSQPALPDDVPSKLEVADTGQNGIEPKQDDTTLNVKPVEIGPKMKKSGFESYFANINQGKKILCFFAPSCDHCRATAKQLTALKNTMADFPQVQILFMDEAAEEIPSFFEFAGASFNYKVLDIIEFWRVLGSNRDVPGVVYLWNGNVVKFYSSSEGAEAFNKADLKTQLEKQKLR